MFKIFHDTVLEREDGIKCELYEMMFNLKTKLQQWQMDAFYGMETDVILQCFLDTQAAVIKEDMSNSYLASLNYLEK